MFTPLELSLIFSHYNHKRQSVVINIYVIDQQKFVHNCEVDEK